MRISGILGKESSRSSTSTTRSDTSSRKSWASSAGKDPASSHLDFEFLAALVDSTTGTAEETPPPPGKRNSKNDRSVSPKRESSRSKSRPRSSTRAEGTEETLSLPGKRNSRKKSSVSPKRSGSRSKSKTRESTSAASTKDPAMQGIGRLEQKYMESLLSTDENDYSPEDMVALRKVLQEGNKLTQKSLMKKSLASKVA